MFSWGNPLTASNVVWKKSVNYKSFIFVYFCEVKLWSNDLSVSNVRFRNGAFQFAPINFPFDSLKFEKCKYKNQSSVNNTV